MDTSFCLLALLWATVAMPTTHMEISETDEQSNQMMAKVLEQLQRAQNVTEQQKLHQRHLVLNTINHKFPWLSQKNALPNYFIHKKEKDTYKNGKVVFMQHHRAAGTAVRNCMDDYGRETLQAWSPVMNSDARADWDAGSLMDSHLRERLKFHHGMFSFNLCDSHEGPCSYFTILRDPLSRAKSSYEYCKYSGTDEMCQGLNANKVDLRDWIIHHGSLLFNQLLFKSDICLNFTASKTTSTKTPPCWLLHKSHMEALGYDERCHLLDYVLQNLDKWFSTIGIYEDLNNSLQMMESIYKIPFTSCKHLQKLTNDLEINDNRANRKKHSKNEDSKNQGNIDSNDYYDYYNDPEFLKYDYMVQRTLAPDYKIYEKAKELYKIQKQKYFNKL